MSLGGERVHVSSRVSDSPSSEPCSYPNWGCGPSRCTQVKCKISSGNQLAKSNHPATLRPFGLQPSPQRCLTKASGTPDPETTARALAAAAFASTRLVSSESTTSTCAVSASVRRPRISASTSTDKRS